MTLPVFRKLFVTFFAFMVAALASAPPAMALTSGDTYTVTIDKLSSSGTVTDLGLSTSGTADTDGKLSFSISGVPDNSSCNFLIIKIKDAGNTVVRKSVVPCPDSGGTLPAGVSGVTGKQTDALISAMAAAGTDDPILAVFGFALVRSTGISATDLAVMASLANQGISGTGGFVDYLTSNGVSSTQLSEYRSSIVSRLADPTSGYTKLYKDAVDAADSTTAAEKRGEAAALLLNVLVKAATTADFSQDRVLEAFNAMGSIVVPGMQTEVTAGNLTAAAAQMVNSNIGGGIQKLKAEKNIEKYSNALSTLGGSSADLTQYQSAATTLMDTMTAAFQEFEKVFTGTETESEIQSAQNTLDSTMQSAFGTFMTSVAASNSRIDTMIANIDNALGTSTGLTRSEFQFYKNDGSTVNWPVTMVIPTDWISSTLSAGGDVAYTRDTTAIPAQMTWLGTCNDPGFWDKTSCETNGFTWTAGRTDFVSDGVPAAYAAVLGLQEDVMILEFARWEDQASAGDDMSAHTTLEKQFANAVAGLASNVSGTTDGSTSITTAQKEALVTLMQSPQF